MVLERGLSTKIVALLGVCLLNLLGSGVLVAQETVGTNSVAPSESLPQVTYSRPVERTIAGLRVVGNESYDEQVVLNLSGLKVGQRVEIPGEEVTQAVKNYLRNGLFTDVRIEADRMDRDSVWLAIYITEQPRLSELNILGVKNSEAKDLKEGELLAMQQGSRVSPNITNTAEIMIERFFNKKGFSSASVNTEVLPDPNRAGYVIVNFHVDKHSKTRVHEIHFFGNENISDVRLKRVMKKTNEHFNLVKRPINSILEIFSQKKFVQEDYKADLTNIIDVYHEHGYRDAEILKDTIYRHDDKRINIDIHLSEGDKYYIKDINFVGNTKYSTEDLERLLGMSAGDVYDQKKLDKRLHVDDDALSNLYSNNGYLFVMIDPIEREVKADSVALDIRISEGKPATINKVVIRGNDHVYEEVVRRELYTKPGMLFNRDYVIRTMRQIMQMGHFDQEKIAPNLIPNQENGTVDIEWSLVPKSNDQIELSLGWSQTGIIGMAGLKFSNFSMRNLFNPGSYRGFLPRGDGQTLSLRAQTNARYYQSYSIQFIDPWFGRKRPNTLSISMYYSRQTDINTRFFNSQQQQYAQMYPYGYGYGYPYGGYGGYPYGGYGGYGGYPYGGYGGYGYGGYGYGGYGYGYDMSALYESAFDPDKTLDMFGAGISYGKRLTWPDDNYQILVGLNYTMYRMRNWSSYYYNFGMENGTANDINLSVTLSRNSIDNPVYTRRGSDFTFTGSATLPYSLFDGVDYSDMSLTPDVRNKFIEYYKLKGKGQIFIPLIDPYSEQRTPVLMASLESGVIGSYNQYKQSPFGTYYMGGDGMTGYYGGYLNEMIGLRGYRNGSIAGASGAGAYTYAKAYMELRYPIISENSTMIWIHGFVEAGNAWQRLQDYNPFQLKRSAGLGVRIMLPMVGLMGIDWGYGFDAPDGTNTIGGSNIHFMIGQQF